MLRPRGHIGLEAQLFGLGLGFMASGLGLVKIGPMASKVTTYMALIDIHNLGIRTHS